MSKNILYIKLIKVNLIYNIEEAFIWVILENNHQEVIIITELEIVIADQIAGQIVDQIVDQIVGQIVDRIVDQIVDQIVGRIADRIVDQIVGRIADQIAGRIDGRILYV